MTWQEIGDRVFRKRYERLDQNIGVILTEDGAVVIDSRSDHDDADELRTDIAMLTGSPIRWLVNTHMHWDHTFGNARFPDAVIVGHKRCRQRLIDEGTDRRDELAAAVWPYGGAKPRFEEVEIMPPLVTFVDEMTIATGGREIALRHAGRGHTDNDIVAMIEDVCFAGDLLEEGAPPAFDDAYPREWAGTLAVMESWLDESVKIVPGHGDVVDLGFLREQAADIAAAVRAIETRIPGPWPPEVMAAIERRL